MTPYAASKVAAEFLGLQAFLGRGLRVVRARPFNHVGPGQVGRLRRLRAGAAHGRGRAGARPVRCGSATSPPRGTSPTSATSCAPTGFLRLKGVAGEAYNVCSGRAVSIAALAEADGGLLSCEVSSVEDPALFRPVEVPVLVGDASKLVAATGWHPTIALATTLSDVLDYWRERLG